MSFFHGSDFSDAHWFLLRHQIDISVLTYQILLAASPCGHAPMVAVSEPRLLSELLTLSGLFPMYWDTDAFVVKLSKLIHLLNDFSDIRKCNLENVLCALTLATTACVHRTCAAGPCSLK